MEVITYQLAYLSDLSVSLCDQHASCGYFGAIGPVQHGRHDGQCDACEREWIRRSLLLVDDD